MQDDDARIEAYEARIGELEAIVAVQAETIRALRELNERLEARVGELCDANEQLPCRRRWAY